MKFPVIGSRIKRLNYKTPVLIEGKPGIGKTQWVKKLANDLGLEFVKLDCAQSGDAGDLIGLLEIVNHEHIHTKPSWLNTDKPCLVFIDELNRAKKEVIAALMQLCSPEQGFNGHYLAPGSRVIVAQNPSDVDYNDCDSLNRPLRTRFAYYYAECDVETWDVWAKENGISHTIRRFIRDNPDDLIIDSNDMEMDDPNNVNPRSWENFSYLYENSYTAGEYTDSDGNFTPEGLELIRQDANSILGPDMAIMFRNWCEKQGKLLSSQKILNASPKMWDEYKDYIKDSSGITLTKLNNSIATALVDLVDAKKLTKKHAENFNTYFFAIPREIRAQMWSSYLKDMMIPSYPGTKWLRDVFNLIGEDAELAFKTELKNLVESKDRMMCGNVENKVVNQPESDKYSGLFD